MSQRVILTLSSGSFESGFPASLRIREDNAVEREQEYGGQLLAAPDIPHLFSQWQSAFIAKVDSTARQFRIKNVETNQFSCKQAATKLEKRLNQWLDSGSDWQKVRDGLLQLDRSDEIRFIIQTDNRILTRLPWHLWQAFFDRYQNAEVAIASKSYERVNIPLLPKAKVRILGVFGDDKELNLNADRSFLADLRNSNVEPVFIEPDRQEFTNFLQQEEGWDLLFFAGHSRTDNKIGKISLTEESIEMNDLKYALQKAISQGLQLAIFNSCDGSGIAEYLIGLNIPQIIIMRESVPDRVAQEFLKYFLSAFTRGKSFYSAVREARERLQGLENEFPYASWIPMIYQNPAVVPQTWRELGGWYSSAAENLLIREKGIDYVQLQNLLVASNWLEADRKTRQIVLRASGREDKGWLDLESLSRFPKRDLCAIDHLWLKYSDGRFGFSVQKQIWSQMGENAVPFGDRVGWRKDSSWLLYYSDFTFSLNAPVGHLPCFARWCFGWRLWEDICGQELGPIGNLIGQMLTPGLHASSLFLGDSKWDDLSEGYRTKSMTVLISRLADRNI